MALMPDFLVISRTPRSYLLAGVYSHVALCLNQSLCIRTQSLRTAELQVRELQQPTIAPESSHPYQAPAGIFPRARSLSCPCSTGGHSGPVFAESLVEPVPTGGRAPWSCSSASTRGSKILTIGKGKEGSPLVSDAQRSFVSREVEAGR